MDNEKPVQYNEFEVPPGPLDFLDGVPERTVDDILNDWKELHPENVEEIFLSWLESSTPGVKSRSMEHFEQEFKSKVARGKSVAYVNNSTVQAALDTITAQQDYAERAQSGNLTQEELTKRQALSIWFSSRWPFNLDDEPNWSPRSKKAYEEEREAIHLYINDSQEQKDLLDDLDNEMRGRWSVHEVVQAVAEWEALRAESDASRRRQSTD